MVFPVYLQDVHASQVEFTMDFYHQRSIQSMGVQKDQLPRCSPRHPSYPPVVPGYEAGDVKVFRHLRKLLLGVIRRIQNGG